MWKCFIRSCCLVRRIFLCIEIERIEKKLEIEFIEIEIEGKSVWKSHNIFSEVTAFILCMWLFLFSPIVQRLISQKLFYINCSSKNKVPAREWDFYIDQMSERKMIISKSIDIQAS